MTPALAVLIACLGAGGPPAYTAAEITPEEEMTGSWTADLDGDSRRDVIIGVYSGARGRELLVHLQRPEGGFLARPDRRVAVKADIIAFAAADLRAEPGEELLLLTRSSGFTFSTAREEYAGNARRLFSWNLLCDVPDRKRVLHLGGVMDADGDRVPEILLPGPDGFALLGGEREAGPAAGGAFTERARFPCPAAGGPPARRGAVRLDLADLTIAGRKERPAGLVAAGGDAGGPLLDSERWLPVHRLADADGDGRLDVVRLAPRAGKRFLEVFLQKPGGGFASAPDFAGEARGGGAVRLGDLDGDPRIDLVLEGEEGAGEKTLRFHRNRGGSFDLERPDQVMKFSGYGVEARTADLDGDGRPELAVTAYSIPPAGALGEGTVIRTLLIHAREEGGLFGRRPAFKLEEKFTAREFKGVGQRPLLGPDLGGGRRAVVGVDRDGALAARRIGKDLEVEREPFWRHAPRRTTLAVEEADLNGDRRADFILRHLRSLTVLVSRP